MKITDLRQLKELIQLCRKMGVASIEVDGIKLSLDEAPSKPTRKAKDATTDKVETEPEYTYEELATWSSAGHG